MTKTTFPGILRQNGNAFHAFWNLLEAALEKDEEVTIEGKVLAKFDAAVAIAFNRGKRITVTVRGRGVGRGQTSLRTTLEIKEHEKSSLLVRRIFATVWKMRECVYEDLQKKKKHIVYEVRSFDRHLDDYWVAPSAKSPAPKDAPAKRWGWQNNAIAEPTRSTMASHIMSLAKSGWTHKNLKDGYRIRKV